jgi:Pyruvate/2-oxoacid:ferredoxin oxidoreductase delta subunit
MNRPLMIVSGDETPDAPNAMERAVIGLCRERGLDCLLIPHLYHVSDSSGLWQKLAERIRDSALLCWLHPRPVRWLLRQRQVAGEGLAILNLSDFPDAESVVGRAIEELQETPYDTTSIRRQAVEPDSPPGATERFPEATRPRWYPVIDGSRCVNCQHCLQFCLFGVYELDAEGRVAVCNPDQCKPGCPACARICPESAIMFPLYRKDAAIAGAPGRFVTLDAAARKMFYARSGQPCPVCGMTTDRKSQTAAGGNACLECGRLQPAETLAADAAPSANRLPFDDLDDLVDRLDAQMQRRR